MKHFKLFEEFDNYDEAVKNSKFLHEAIFFLDEVTEKWNFTFRGWRIARREQSLKLGLTSNDEERNKMAMTKVKLMKDFLESKYKIQSKIINRKIDVAHRLIQIEINTADENLRKATEEFRHDNRGSLTGKKFGI